MRGLSPLPPGRVIPLEGYKTGETKQSLVILQKSAEEILYKDHHGSWLLGEANGLEAAVPWYMACREEAKETLLQLKVAADGEN